jgi:hypothetical protein
MWFLPVAESDGQEPGARVHSMSVARSQLDVGGFEAHQ